MIGHFAGYHAPMYASSRRSARSSTDRLRALELILLAMAVLVVIRLFVLQVVHGGEYRLLASDQHELQESLIPERGRILVRDRADGTLHPLATNRDAWTVYAVPRQMEGSDAGTGPADVARQLVPLLPGITKEATSSTIATYAATWEAKRDDPYEPITSGLTTEQADAIRALQLPGIGLVKGWARFYPERGIGGHLVGFVRPEDSGMGVGAYGIEGAFNAALSGTSGTVSGVKDAGGRRIAFGEGALHEATDGSDVVLTVDRTIQYEVCTRLERAVRNHGADGGSVVIIVPDTGAVLAMCSVPDFDPDHYGDVKNISVFNNPATFAQYEPGSVFKAFTMAVGLDRDKILPKTTYVDTGEEKIDEFTIRNSDGKAHGLQTMTQVLDESLNTGTIFVQRLVGHDLFRAGIEAFGFGKITGIELTPEARGDVSSLGRKGEIYGATASYGQGISVTPLQLTAGYAALGNGGTLMRPYIVDEIIHPDGFREKTKPQVQNRTISLRAAQLVTGMLVSVVERGHGTRAGVRGYYVAGKTGTAQVPNPNGPGYLEDTTIGSFAGYAPADDPRFAMLVKIDHPRDVQWAESSAAPLWGDIASFLLSYLDVPMERDPGALPEVETLPVLPVVTSTGRE